MYRYLFINLLTAVLVAFLDAAFIGSLPFGLHRLHLLPLALIFVLLLSNIRLAAWWALSGGLVLELFSFRWFGSYLIIIFIILIVIQVLLEKVVTNRSIYSIIIISTIIIFIWDLAFLLIDYFANVAISGWLNNIRVICFSLIVNIIIASITFYIINAVSRRFKPVFLSFRK